jgi:hypothetical protein
MLRVRIKIAHRPPEVSSSSFVAIPKYSIFPIKKARPVRYSHQSPSERRACKSSEMAALQPLKARSLGNGFYMFSTDLNPQVDRVEKTVKCEDSDELFTLSYARENDGKIRITVGKSFLPVKLAIRYWVYKDIF